MSKSTIREAVGIFFGQQQLEEALQDLQESGFEHDEIGLLAGEHAIEKSLGELYSRVNTYTDRSKAPETAFVKNESLGETFRSLSNGLVFTGASSAMGVAVVSAGIFGGAVVVAAAGAVAVAGVSALVGTMIHQSDAEYLEEQVDKGHLLLFVRVSSPEEERQAVEILSRHAAYDARVHEVRAG